METNFVANSIEKIEEYLELGGRGTLVLTIFERGEITQKGLDLVDYLADNIDRLSDDAHDIVLNIPYEKLPKNVFENFFNLDNKLKQKPNSVIKFCVKHMNTIQVFDKRTADVCWDFDTIVNANASIDNVCDFLRNSGLSPFEMLAYILHYVSTVAPYSRSHQDKYMWRDKDQFFAGAYQKLPEVVCTGYSSLMKEIIDNLDMPELKCNIISLEFLNKNTHHRDSHARCLVRVQDAKYGLEQMVFEDATWDNPSVTQNIACYTHFAMPNHSLENSANGHYVYSYPDVF